MLEQHWSMRCQCECQKEIGEAETEEMEAVANSIVSVVIAGVRNHDAEKETESASWVSWEQNLQAECQDNRICRLSVRITEYAG